MAGFQRSKTRRNLKQPRFGVVKISKSRKRGPTYRTMTIDMSRICFACPTIFVELEEGNPKELIVDKEDEFFRSFAKVVPVIDKLVLTTETDIRFYNKVEGAIIRQLMSIVQSDPAPRIRHVERKGFPMKHSTLLNLARPIAERHTCQDPETHAVGVPNSVEVLTLKNCKVYDINKDVPEQTEHSGCKVHIRKSFIVQREPDDKTTSFCERLNTAFLKKIDERWAEMTSSQRSASRTPEYAFYIWI